MATTTVRFDARRLGSAGFVLLLHAVVVAALLSATFRAPPQPPRETVIQMKLLPLEQRTAPAAKRVGGEAGTVALPVPEFRNAAPSANAITLGAALFGCRMDNLGDLSPEQREKCARQTGMTYAQFAAQPLKFPPPGLERLRNSDIAARKRNTADPCLIAKQSGTECIHETLFGSALP